MNGVWLELVGFAANIAEPAGAEGQRDAEQLAANTDRQHRVVRFFCLTGADGGFRPTTEASRTV